METVDEYLAHFGKKGMHWGVRTARPSKTPGPHASEDVKRAHTAKTKIGKGNNTEKLSNKELQDLVTRMNLEKQFSTLSPSSSKVQTGRKFLKGALVTGKTVNEVVSFANSPAGKAIRAGLKKG